MTVSPTTVALLAVGLAALLGLSVGLLAGLAAGRARAGAQWRARVDLLDRQLARERQAAEDRLALAREEAERRRSVEQLVAPVAGSLERLARQVEAADRARAETQAALRAELGEQARHLGLAADAVRRETGRLATALGRSEVRGRWGEVQLRRLVEAAGLLDRVHFTEQASTSTDDGMLRPDLVVHLAGDKHLVVDAKVPLNAFLLAEAAPDDAARDDLLARHAAELAAHVDRLAAKAYWRQFDSAPEFVVLFLPAESLLAEALAHDPTLLDRAFARGVVPATPTTMLALLRTVAHVWRQDSAARHAREVHALGRELYDRLGTLGGHVARLGSALDSAVTAYNRTVASLEGRVLVSARRFAALGVTDADLEGPPQVERGTRRIQAAELMAGCDGPGGPPPGTRVQGAPWSEQAGG